MPADDWIAETLNDVQEPRRLAVLQRRFFSRERADVWALIFNQLAFTDRATAEVVPTWYGFKVIVYLREA